MENRYPGMTVNERLYLSGLIGDFDKAVKERDADAIVSILKKVDLTEVSIDPILENMGLKRNDNLGDVSL